MKRIILFFAVCLGLSVSQTTSVAFADTQKNTSKRTTATVVTSNRGENQSVKNTRSAIKQPTQQRVVGRTVTDNSKSRATTQSKKNVLNRTTTRSATQSRVVNNAASRSANSNTNRQRATRTKELNIEKMDAIKAADYSQCKSVYYECMDEFCANKDANLRRCACSSRIHEFDNIQKQLDAAEDKMLDFNQRLFTVSLDKEDAAAISVASEGELAFDSTKDKSKSEKYLKKIQKTLDSSSNSKFDSELSTISLSLDIDSAWDDVDSYSGVATTSKSGLSLYNAARPICVEMAQEVCTDDELKIAQDGYKLTIQQDCNTVAKSYETLYNNAMEKIRESGALLDMARLDSYQQRNSDDTLTCKKKILDKLSETSVCGEDLHKCLDMTGEYIDPATGKAFLSENLKNLANLLKEPTGNMKWSELSQNEPFVNFLKSKKKFLTTATEQCREISDTIWREFLDDALSQIKLAQRAKLEEVRQGCTKLISECKTKALTDLADFDARTLSVFKINANKTANEMCSDVQNSCITLMGETVAGEDWGTGIAGITTDMSYDAVIDTCTQIGRDCIIQKCNGTSGNFALCTNIISDNRIAILKRDACWQNVLDCVKNSDNLVNMKKGILSYDIEDQDASRRKYYDALYSGYNVNNISTFCTDENNQPLTDQELKDCLFNHIPTFCDAHTETDKTACLIAEQIWGNCETNNNDYVVTTLTNLPMDTIPNIQSNKILIPNIGSTLMSWFATNTGTTTSPTSCSTYGCPINYKNNHGTCQQLIDTNTDDCQIATNKNQRVTVKDNLINFCASGVRDAFGNCCANGFKDNGICTPSAFHHALPLFISECRNCNEFTDADEHAACELGQDYFCPGFDLDPNNPRKIYYYCITTDDAVTYSFNANTNEWEYICDGDWWILVDLYGNYFNNAEVNTSGGLAIENNAPSMSYIKDCADCNENPLSCTTCNYDYGAGSGGGTWSFGSCTDGIPVVPTNHEFIITYQ